MPTACSEACADVLLQMQTSCHDFLGMIGMQETIDTAASSCAPPLEPCTSYPEFMAYSQEVTAACCDDASAPCVAGLPTTCSDACADVLLPMQRACNDFLAMMAFPDDPTITRINVCTSASLTVRTAPHSLTTTLPCSLPPQRTHLALYLLLLCLH